MFRRLLPVLSALMLVSVLTIACGPGGGQRAGDPNRVEIKGSDTMVNLCAGWAEAFMAANPGTRIEVTGGGSGTGIRALIEGITDICSTSRDMRDPEVQMANQRGYAPVRHVVGLDGLAVIAHPSNPIDSITIQQLKDIYTGRISNWNQLGGDDMRMVINSRETSSGTYLYFQEHVMDNEDFRPDVLLMKSSATIATNVASDRGGIGYLGVAYAEGANVKILPVRRDADSPAIMPDMEHVQDGTYPIARPLLLYTTEGNTKELVDRFLEFAKSPEGQAIVEAQEYIPLSN